MEAKQRIDIFVGVHKGLRRGLLNLSVRLGNLDWSDPDETAETDGELKKMIHFLREHGENEDLVQVPFLENRSPGATKEMAEDHRKLEREVDQLEGDWEKILSLQGSRAAAGYRFYLAFNRFLSAYLAHMDLEEREITDAVHRLFADDEIKREFQKIIARTSPQDMVMMLGYMIPGMSHFERCLFLSNLRDSAPPQVFERVWELARKVLTAKDWEKLSAELG